ncbi:MAG: DNA polymerase I [Chloroflexota bacterium]
MSASRPIFYLIDAHAVAYRQFFGLPLASFSTRAGEPTNATYGFTRILLDILQKDRPDFLAVTFDMGLSGRDTLYAEYKGTRGKMPDELSVQMDRIVQVVRAFNIPVLAMEGYEADDIIGTITQQAPDVHFRIITGDRDLLQLLADNVTVALPSRDGPDEIYDTERFKERYQIAPEQLVDMKALMGDSSDNIPGVRGIGEKTAVKLLQQFGSLDGIYENLDQIKGANHRKLAEGHDDAYMSQKLARIQQDLPIQLVLDACIAHDFDRGEVVSLFRDLEFRTFTDRLLNEAKPEQLGLFGDESSDDNPVSRADHVVETVIINDEAGLADLITTLKKAKALVWDVETDSIDQMRAQLVGIAIAVDGERGYYIPLGHQKGKQLPMQQVIDALRPVMVNPEIAKYAHNAVYDMVVCARYGLDVQPVVFDTMIAEWLIDPTSKFLGLKNFADQYLQVHMTPIADLIGTGKKQKTMDQVAVENAAPYAAADAAITYRAAEFLQPRLKENDLQELYKTLEIPLIPVIAAMEQAGIALDVQYLAQLNEELKQRIAALEKEIYGLSGGYGEFNINSPKQLNDVLFGKLGLSVEGLRKMSHGYSTDAATLEKLRVDTGHPIILAILKYRELTKLQGTYVEALPQLVHPQTGRIHTSYNQTGTTTGRLSSNNPNLQNIPIRTEIGREVRRAFVAPSGRVLLSVDYSQIELRVLAHISEDPTLLAAFADNQDIHRATAAAVYGIDPKEVTYEQRSFAKRVNFGLIYGMGAFRLARDSDLTLAESTAFIDTYFERLPNVQKYIERTKNKAREDGFVETLFGRKRFFPALQNAGGRVNRAVVEAELRAAVNMPIQGTAADIMKRAMIDLYRALEESGLSAQMTLQVHDELVLEVVETELQQTCDLVVEIMENAYRLDAPLRANAQAGQNWRDMADL